MFEIMNECVAVKKIDIHLLLLVVNIMFLDFQYLSISKFVKGIGPN